jgi:hypothetical protein
MQGIKHLIQCNCILPQFRNVAPPVFHEFPVFSVIRDDDTFIQHYAECNNCSAQYKITEIGIAQRLPRETSSKVPQIGECKLQIPNQKLVSAIEKYECGLPTWQEISFVLENKQWGTPVILTKEVDDGVVSGKFLLILGEQLFKIDAYSNDHE